MATIGFLIWDPTHASGSIDPAGLSMQQPAPIKHVVWGSRVECMLFVDPKLKRGRKGLRQASKNFSSYQEEKSLLCPWGGVRGIGGKWTGVLH